MPSRNARRIHPSVALTLTLALAATACGSTVQQTGAAGGFSGAAPADPSLGLPEGAPDSELSAEDGTASTGDGTFSGASPGSASGSTGQPGSRTGSGGSSSAETSSGTADGSGAGSGAAPGGGAGGGAGPAPGVSAKEIRVGFPTFDDEAATADQFGIEGASSGDTRRQMEALAKDLNARGGILGRKVVLVPRAMSLANMVRDPATEEQAACTYWTEDEQVFAVISGQFVFLTPCLGKRGVTTVGGGGIVDTADRAQDRYFGAGGAVQTALARVFLSRLVAQGYFRGWDTAAGAPGKAPAKVGMIYQDLPTYHRYYKVVMDDLRARKIPFSEPVIYAPTGEGVASASSSAVLKFRSEGVTHVFGAALLFFQAAESQGYRPRYSFDSRVPPAIIAQNVGPEQMEGAMGVGFQPAYDVEKQQDPGNVSPEATRCQQIMTKAGVNWEAARSVQFAVLSKCAGLWSLEAAMERARVIGADALPAAFAGLGERRSAITFRENWRPDRLASASVVADLQYVVDCRCFTYTKARTSF